MPTMPTMPLQIKMEPKVLIVGNGAREHAIAWKLMQSPWCPQIFVAPGNAGTAAEFQNVEIAVDDVDGLVAFCVDETIDLVMVGPEQPLSLGLVDACKQAGIRVCGPEKAAAELESSKTFAKQIMAEADVPTAAYRVFTDAAQAKAYVLHCGAPIVVKADGLAAGKGVIVATTEEMAMRAIDDILVGGQFGQAGSRVVLESFLTGQEVSLMFFVDADTVVPMLPARDFKRIGTGDTGSNTGGMGAFAPVASFLAGGATEEVERRVVHPTLAALKNRGITYRGILYVGLMMTAEGPFVVEFNARFGDPETEVILPLLNSDLLEIFWAIAEDSLGAIDITWATDAAVCVVLAAAGYPESPEAGQSIQITVSKDDIVFHAGTKLGVQGVETSGGRVMVTVGRGPDVPTATRSAYHTIDRIYFEGRQFRTDIAANWRD